MIELPDLKAYDVSYSHGFLPEELPLVKLPQERYKIWEDIVSNLPSLILTKKIRSVIDKKLEVLSTSELSNVQEYRRAYSILGFLTHAYIWGVDEPLNKLPVQLSKPFTEVCEYLGLPAIATYSGLCLWNYKLILPEDGNEDDELLNLENLTTINTFTGSIDESWFYLVSVYFEYKGAKCLQYGLDAIKAARENIPSEVVKNFQKMAESIDKLGSVMMKMEEMCDPHIFYFRIRPYLAGWKNMGDVGLENGVFYGDEKTPRIYSGGSNAQSSLIQALDILLNVDHYSTGERDNDKKKNDKSNPFLNEMRLYMPGKHRNFLEHLSKVNCLRDYVLANGDKNPELTLSYDACLAMLKSFRDKHIQIVTRYVIIQAQKSKDAGSSLTKTLRSGLAKSTTKGKNEQKGTGGTALLPFLKQCRDETGDPAAGSWGKRILTDGILPINKKKKLNSENDADDDDDYDDDDGNNQVIGLAGSWQDDMSNKKSGHW
ncbi:hypothetical protein PACTADRAFT_83728 [Pachysolen tannophilus NRRL Y-2460]|uniref:Indoleamine 2,3-dioxygenase n=1 Tax=Pachysolen tannophilus NRRL Y-2460 TaxID=669874 RepID=A0A1E4U390_PACTA|nr:hypothetical protein PACTADRAFT_83728 [Pachysolen tannophilus NRRL Y-2460]